MLIMKKLFMLLLISVTVSHGWSQEQKVKKDRYFRIPLIGEKAPSFTAESTNGTINFPSEFGRSWKILFSHPMDFTPVCSTEIMELARLQDQFDKIGVKLVVLSTDSIYRHRQWKESLEGLMANSSEPAKIRFPLVADISLTVSKEYGMIHPATNTTEPVRGVFVIDPDNIIQSVSFYPMRVGRSTDEILRLVEALQTTTADKVSTPVNWMPGGDVLIPYNPRVDLSKNDVLPAGYYSPVWYMIFKSGGQ
jgi:peroxiredoxin (alkyl hydroperoxide reductase subunit C)